jgi:hypothetical protein
VTKLPVHIAFLQGDQLAVNKGLENVREVVTLGVGYLTERSIVTLAHDTHTSTN